MIALSSYPQNTLLHPSPSNVKTNACRCPESPQKMDCVASSNAVVLEGFLSSLMEAVVLETAVAASKSLALSLFMVASSPHGLDVFPEVSGTTWGLPLTELHTKNKPDPDNQDGSDTEDDGDDDDEDGAEEDGDEDAGDEEDVPGKDGEDGGDPEDDPEANDAGGSEGEDGDGDDDDDDDDEEEEEEDEDEEEDEEEEIPQPPAKRRK